jgi:AraC-like DNA-binding protein
MKELVTLKTIAQRTGYSHGTLMNRWPKILVGVRPMQLRPNGKKLFYWEDVVKRMEAPK